MKSIRRTLLGSLLCCIVLLVAAAAVILHREIDDEIGELFDAQLVQAAYAASGTAAPQAAPHTPAGTEPGDDPRLNLVVTVWPGGAAHAPASAQGFADVHRPDGNWRLYTVALPDHTVQVGQPISVRSEAAVNIVLRIAVPMALLLLLAGASIWYLVGKGLRPLHRFTAELAVRTPSMLHAVPTGELPAELLPMAAALNALMQRLEQALAAQQSFIADAAHEILTPLTALQVQVQLSERTRTEDKRAEVMHDVHTSLERCVRLARQLLTLARQSASLPAQPPRPVQLGSLARQAVEELLPKAHQRHIDLGVIDDAPAAIAGDPDALQIMLRNLLDNAVKYSPPGSRVDITARTVAGSPTLVISDAGPGIKSDEQQRVFDRFYRAAGSEVDGTGLGLAIVKHIVERHGANIRLASPGSLGGLDVCIGFDPHLTASTRDGDA